MQQISFLPGEMTPGERSLILRALKTLDRHLHEPGVAFTSTRAAREWLILNMAGLEREEFRVLYLNNQNQLIAGETLFTGTINRTEVHPREVIKRALYHNAAAVVLAHNHPSGEVTPSKADRLITERLVQALGLVDITVTRNSPTGQAMTADAEAAVSEALRDLAFWLYRQLENEYDWLTSDAAVDEALLINEYTFTEAGLCTG